MDSTIITPAELHNLWQQDKHQVAWLLLDLTEEQRDELAVAYHRWLNRGDIRLTEVQSSFEAIMWLTEPHNPEYQPRPVAAPSPARPSFAPTYDQIVAAYENASSYGMPQNWRNALERGYDLLLASDAIEIEFDTCGEIHAAWIPSQTEPGTTHYCNGACSCQAAQHGNRVCTHRAAKRLLAICWEMELEARRPVAA
jgi:hypothetical protein